MGPTLLVLAAGAGSRYGGLKQIDPVGPSGETVLDYAVFDALRAGFGRVVFVIRRDFEDAFREKVGSKYGDRIRVGYAFQSLADLPAGFGVPAGREKPWGTAHAVWCARAAIEGNFAVINADDFYGADSFGRLSRFLGGAQPAPGGPHRFALVGFRLANTLSENGTVARGVCQAEGGRLRSVTEHTGIAASDVGPFRKFSGEETVSMNCWGFTPALFPALGTDFAAFLSERAGDPKAEFYLPAAVSAMVGRGEAEVEVLPTSGSWFGVTYRDDKPRVQASIAALVASGSYPARLF
jgi:MobA-like NTP transferase domain